MATHCLLYFGNFDRNFSKLKPDTEDYEKDDGTRATGNVPGENVNGIHYGFMSVSGQGVDTFLFVKIDHLVLRAPVLLQYRHTDGKGLAPGSSPTTFGDEAALHILVDAIVANPEYRDVLGKKIVELGRD